MNLAVVCHVTDVVVGDNRQDRCKSVDICRLKRGSGFRVGIEALVLLREGFTKATAFQ